MFHITVLVFAEQSEQRNSKHILTSIPKHLDDQLSNIAMDGVEDLTEKLGCKAPRINRCAKTLGGNYLVLHSIFMDHS